MKINTAIANRAPIILIYGGEGRGKSTLAAKFPKPLALLLERGLPRGVSVDAVEDVGNFEAIMNFLREFYAAPGDYRTLVIDTIDALEALLLEGLCKKNGWKSIESPSYGKGWIAADDEWRRLLRGLGTLRDKHDLTVVLTCHGSIERVDDPRAASYTSYQPRLHKRARGLVMDACDAVFFLAEDLRTVVDTGGFHDRVRAATVADTRRYIFSEGTPAFAAKNRFNMPAKIPLPIDCDISVLSQFWHDNERTPQ
jgi:hypothetical protein